MPNPQVTGRTQSPTRFHAASLAAVAAGAVILLIVLGTMPRVLW
jgi:hypothetical protein